MSLTTVFEGDNIGGIAKLEIAHHLDFASFNPFIFISGRQWLEIELPGSSGELKRKTQETENGKLYSYAGGFQAHNIRNEIDNALLPYIGQSAVLRITDNNGRVYILGEPGNPVELEEESSTGGSFHSVNGYSFSFSVRLTHPAYSV